MDILLSLGKWRHGAWIFGDAVELMFIFLGLTSVLALGKRAEVS